METVDRISELPENILQHILSFLSIKQIVQASSVSKTWQHAWKTHPILHFGYEFFFGLSRYSHLHSKNLRKELFDFVERTLLARYRQMISLRKLEICLSFNDDDDQDFSKPLNRLVGYAAESNVQDLRLEIHHDQYHLGHGSMYKLSATLLSAKSLTSLDLWGCELDISYANAVRFPILKNLSLCYVYSNDNLIQALVGGCPRIEAMSFSSCKGFESLHLHNLFMLTQLTISDTDLKRVTVVAPNLDSLCICMPSEHLDLNMAACKNLKSFALFSASAITDKWLHELLSNFRNMESLSLRNCAELENIKVFSPHLQKLDIRYCSKLLGIEFDRPYLFTLVYFWGIASIVSDKLLVQSNADQELSFKGYHCDFSSSRFSRSMFCSQPHCSVALHKSHLLCEKGEELIVPGELAENTSRLLCSAKESILRSSYTGCTIVELVDALLSIDPHAERLCIKSFNTFSFKFSFGGSVRKDVDTHPCSKSQPVACWKNCIRDVKVEKVGSGDSYYFDYNVWENINFLLGGCV